MNSYPLISPINRRIQAKKNQFQSWALLNYIDYNKEGAKKLITEKLDWRDYGGKHYESIFTRFYQGYILPTKFKVDKRKAHLSNLIFSGQITKQEALSELEKPIYPADLFKSDYNFVIKKLGFTNDEFQKYLKETPVSHSKFDMSLSIFDEIPQIKFLKKIFKK